LNRTLSYAASSTPGGYPLFVLISQLIQPSGFPSNTMYGGNSPAVRLAPNITEQHVLPICIINVTVLEHFGAKVVKNICFVYIVDIQKKYS
jgi:hypothetical protein